MPKAKAFTLIELLVVIAIISLLLAILIPTLRQVGRQARAVVCQSNERQWGLAFAAYASDNDGKLYVWRPGTASDRFLGPPASYWQDCNDLFLCPMAAKTSRVGWEPETSVFSTGSTFLPWEINQSIIRGISSYGLSGFLEVRGSQDDDCCWHNCLVTNASAVPVLLDSRQWVGSPHPSSPPPEYEDGPPVELSWGVEQRSSGYMWPFVIDRHDGGLNCLFLDWSVRKIGLKELWTLKWHRQYDTAGKWTKAGGVKPEDWPQWMRKFKDY